MYVYVYVYVYLLKTFPIQSERPKFGWFKPRDTRTKRRFQSQGMTKRMTGLVWAAFTFESNTGYEFLESLSPLPTRWRFHVDGGVSSFCSLHHFLNETPIWFMMSLPRASWFPRIGISRFPFPRVSNLWTPFVLRPCRIGSSTCMWLVWQGDKVQRDYELTVHKQIKKHNYEVMDQNLSQIHWGSNRKFIPPRI